MARRGQDHQGPSRLAGLAQAAFGQEEAVMSPPTQRGPRRGRVGTSAGRRTNPTATGMRKTSRGGESLPRGEGALKALALSAVLRDVYRVCVVALSGVWGWKGKGELGASVAIADLAESIAWKERKITIAFDSDAETNPLVGQARDRLTAFLR